jgi:hypothetical protein
MFSQAKAVKEKVRSKMEISFFISLNGIKKCAGWIPEESFAL